MGVTKYCGRCGTDRPFEEWATSQWARSGTWCNPCYREWHRERYVPKGGATDEVRNCATCETPYSPKSRRPSIYCSRTCKGNARKEALRLAREQSKPQRQCVWCRSDMPQKMRSDAKFCSEQCNSAAHVGTRKMWSRLGVPKGDIQLVSRTELAERDGLGCYLCGRKLNLSTKHPDPSYASIDHVLPLARGGQNELANLRLAHLVCNLRKRDKILAD